MLYIAHYSPEVTFLLEPAFMHTQPRGFACLPVLSLRNKAETVGSRVEGMRAAALQCCLCGSLIASLTFTFSNERIQKEGTSPATQCELKKPSLCPPLQGRCLCK